MPSACPATWSLFLTGKSRIQWTNDPYLGKQKLLKTQRHFPCPSWSLVIDALLNLLTTQTHEIEYLLYGWLVPFCLGSTLWWSSPRSWSSSSWARRSCLLSACPSSGASGCSGPSRWRGERNICYFQQKKNVIAKVISKPLLAVIGRNVNPCLQNICSSGKNLSGSRLITDRTI